MAHPELFLRCMKVILKNEGGYSNHPNDPGGCTYKGITQRVYDNYRIRKGLPTQSVTLMTDEELYDIYFLDYWEPMKLDGIEEDGLVLQLFDFGVNAGINTSIRLIQRIVGVEDDGKMGPITKKAINEYDEKCGESLYCRFMSRRKTAYMNLVAKKPKLEVFLNGWIKRIYRTKF